ncbi:MAG: pyridoxal kinase [Alphaproteobacteria bacterium]|nr:pyridoxal kinase [Alphaproteobacteria bacterium]
MGPGAVLSISSQVAFGHVGNSVAVPALQARGLPVLAVPTLVSSNHPGLGRPFGFEVTAMQLGSLFDALYERGALDDCAAVITGYFVSAEQVMAVARFLRRLRAGAHAPHVMVDAILGYDDKGLFVPEAVAKAIRDELRPLASAIKANRFELQWLTGHDVTDAATATVAARQLGAQEVLVSSVPTGSSRIGNLLVTATSADIVDTRKLAGVPKGTGDLLTALWVAARLSGLAEQAALADASQRLATVIAASRRGPTLVLDPLFAAKDPCP